MEETPGDFIRRLRLEKAAYLLLYIGQQPITDIAYQSGFSSSQNMARTFNMRFHLAPGAFREYFYQLSLIENGASAVK